MSGRRSAEQWAAEQTQKHQRPRWPVIPYITEEQRYRSTWANTLIARGREHGDLPLFGSRAWCQLADDDPRKAASAVRAAEAWARQGDDMAFTLLTEDHEHRRAEDEHWARVHAGRRHHVDDQLARMRVNENRATTTTSRDAQAGYTGGATSWETNEGGARGLHHRDATDAA